jgi:rhamnosyltransferase
VHLESVSRDLRSSREAANLALYKNRWADKVRPDDVQYYLNDGLLNFRYDGQYPLAVTVSPMLALQEEQARFRQAETLLSHRAKQVMALLKENIRLGVKVSEAAGCKDVTPAAAPAAAAVTDPKVLARGDFSWLSEEPVDRSVSILIPVKNGEKTLRELLPVLWEQKVREKVEIVAIDSGSTDGSVQLLIEAGATVIAIDPRSFNHGLTRNLLASFARGDVLVFLVQDAIPADDHWLANLIAPLRDPGVAGVCSRALPHVDADPLTRFDTMNDPNGSDQRHIRLITDRAAYDRLAHHPLRLFINFHNMASAMRADLFAKYPFRKVDPFGEDLAWAKELLEAGFKIQHEPSSVIRHSHDYGFAELLRRNYDDGRASRQIVGRTLADHEVVPLIGQLVRRDWEYLEGETGMLGEELEQWRVRAVLRRTAQIVGQWLGVNQHQLPIDLTSLLSITSRIRQAVMEPAKQEVLA